MIQERRLRVTHTVHTRKNNRLLKAKKGLTNSLPLRQLSILSLTQSIVFQVWAKHATHSSSSLYHPSNMKLLEVHIFCFLFIEKDEFLRQILLNTNMFEIWISFYSTSGTSASQVEFFFRESRNQIATKKSTDRQTLRDWFRWLFCVLGKSWKTEGYVKAMRGNCLKRQRVCRALLCF